MLIERNEDSFIKLIEVLAGGGVAIMACDTIYGFVGRVPDTEQLIRGIKGRGETKPFLQLVSDRHAAVRFGARIPDHPIIDLWPGPFTFVLPTDDGSTVAYRVPKDDRLRRLLKELDEPLYSTSVNRAGFPPMDDPTLIQAEFGNEVDLVEDSGLYSGKSPSTVVNLTSNPYAVLRQGAGTVPDEFLR